MADSQRTIDLIFNGVDKTGAAVDGVLKNTSRFSSGVQTATQPLADFTTSALKFEAAILATGAALTGFAIKEAASFEASLADLNKVLSDTDSLEQYAQLARNLSEEYGVASTEIVQSIANYKQAGFTAEEAGQLTKSGLDLVIAGGVEAARSSDLLVASLKGFGAEAASSSTIVDLLNQVSNEYAVSVDQLLEGFSTFSPIARSAGLSLQETIGVLTPGIEVFRSGSEVANALRTSFLRLQDDSKPVTDALELLGVAQRDANGELRSGRDIFFDVADALQGVDQNQKAYIASQLVGIQRSSQFLAVTDGLDKTLRIAGDGFQFLGSAAKEVEIQLNTFDNVANRVGAALSNLFVDLGTPLLDDFSGLGDAIVSVFRTLGDNIESGGLGDFSQFLQASIQGLEDDARQVAQNLPAALEQADFSGFEDGLRAIGESISNLFSGLDITSVEGLVTAIEALGGGFNALSQFSAGAIESFGPLFDLITDLAAGSGEAAERFRELGNIGGVATQINAFAGAVSSALPLVEGLVAAVGINQASGLVGSLLRAGGALSGQAGLLAVLGKTGLVGAAGAAGLAIGALADKTVELSTGSGLSDRLGSWLDSFTGLNREAELLTQSLDLSGTGAAASIAELDRQMGLTNEEVRKAVDFWGEYGSTSGQVVENTIPVLFDIEDAWQEIQSATQSTTEATKQLNEATQEISLDEKLALIESNSQIATARIQADAQVMSSAFDSIGVSVSSTADLLGDLFGQLGNDNISKFDKLGLKEQIEIENERREDNLRLQERLVNAQIRELNLRAEALRNGGGLITIDGAGLQPHLEAFMFEILESIQVRVNAEGYNLLLGVD
jgi:TP901 family phage tail tape measure protein